ncbi:MAG: hypothetical protein ALAOOOJD_04395 [bacterium]|nr:hypothetical protein [bacterium]
MLDKIMFQSGLLRLRKNFPEIDIALADLNHFLFCRHVFDMAQRKAARMFGKIGEWVGAGFDDPIKIDLYLHELGIGFREQNVKRNLSLGRYEFKIMIVISKLQPGLLAGLAKFVECGRQFFIIIDGAALLRRQPGAHHIFVSKNLRGFHKPVHFLLKHREALMRCRRLQAETIQ